MEILVAMAILMVIGGGAAVGVSKVLSNSRVKKAKQDVRTIAQAVDAFEMDTGVFPATLEDLVKDPGDLDNWQPGGYLKKNEMPKDPWKGDYVFLFDDAPEGWDYDIVSYGKDGQEGGEDFDKDIRLSELD